MNTYRPGLESQSQLASLEKGKPPSPGFQERYPLSRFCWHLRIGLGFGVYEPSWLALTHVARPMWSDDTRNPEKTVLNLHLKA